MKRLRAAALTMLACACAAPAFAQEVRPALFVARDADSTLYLFGTVHVRRPGAAWGGPDAQAALAEADEVWTEMDISTAGEVAVRRLTLERGMAPADQPLSSWLSDKERTQLAALTARLGVSSAVFEGMRPWLAALTLSFIPISQSGYDPGAGVDRAVRSAAGDAGFRHFETAEDQIGFFADLSEAAQRQMLREAIREAEAGAEQLDEMSSAWERGDLAVLEASIIADMREAYPELYAVIFKRRNHVWVDVLAHEMDGAGVDFVAVGAGHLLGPDGLVTLLRARGVNVERVGGE